MGTKLRSLLTPFYKIAHPDVLSSAPSNIQKANSEAVTTLNSYLDNLEKGDSVQLSSLRFYVPKEDTYRTCVVTLLPLSSSSPPQIKEKHIKTTVNSVLYSITNPQKPTPIPKSRPRMKDELQQQGLDAAQQAMQKEQLKEQYQKMLYETAWNIEKEFISKHPIDIGLQRKPSGIILRALKQKDLSFEKFQEIPWEHIYFEEQLERDQTREAMKSFVSGFRDHEDLIRLRSILKEVRGLGIYLAIGNEWSHTKVSGFMTIPWNFTLDEFFEYYNKHKSQVKGFSS